MHLPTPLLLVSLFFTSTLASSSATTDTGFNFGDATTSTSTADYNFGDATTSTSTADYSFGDATTTSTADYNFGTNTAFDFSISTTITILDGFTVTTSGYSVGETPEPKGEWTLDIHPHNKECLFGTNSYTYSSSESYCFPHGGKSLYFHNKDKPHCTATTFSGRNCRGSSIKDLRSDLCNAITFGSVNVTCT